MAQPGPRQQSCQVEYVNGPAELELLLSSLRCALGRGQTPRIDEHVDWDFLALLAQRHHVQPLLWHGLLQGGAGAVPESVRAGFSARHAANLKQNFRISHHATRILAALTAAGIPVVPWKGVFLAQQEYGQLSLREVNDIDLLVHPDDFRAAADQLQATGFAFVEELDQQQVFRESTLQIEIDLHRQPTPDFFPVGFDFEAIRGRAGAAEFGGQPHLALHDTDLVLLLCVQVAKDAWERLQRIEQLQKLCDLAQVLNNRPDLDSERLLDTATGLGLRRLVLTVLLTAKHLLGADLPSTLLGAAGHDPKALAMARQLADPTDLADPSPAPGSNDFLDLRLRSRQLLFYLRLRERRSDRLAHLGEVLRAMTRLPLSG